MNPDKGMIFWKLYKVLKIQKMRKPQKVVYVGFEEIPEIAEDEIIYAVTSIKTNKAPGNEELIIEMIKQALDIIMTILKPLFNKSRTIDQ